MEHEKRRIEDALAYLRAHDSCVEYYPEFLSPTETEHCIRELRGTVEFNTNEESMVACE